MVRIRGIFFESTIQDVSTLPFLQITDKSRLPEEPGVYIMYYKPPYNKELNGRFI